MLAGILLISKKKNQKPIQTKDLWEGWHFLNLWIITITQGLMLLCISSRWKQATMSKQSMFVNVLCVIVHTKATIWAKAKEAGYLHRLEHWQHSNCIRLLWSTRKESPEIGVVMGWMGLMMRHCGLTQSHVSCMLVNVGHLTATWTGYGKANHPKYD